MFWFRRSKKPKDSDYSGRLNYWQDGTWSLWLVKLVDEVSYVNIPLADLFSPEQLTSDLRANHLPATARHDLEGVSGCQYTIVVAGRRNPRAEARVILRYLRHHYPQYRGQRVHWNLMGSLRND